MIPTAVPTRSSVRNLPEAQIAPAVATAERCSARGFAPSTLVGELADILGKGTAALVWSTSLLHRQGKHVAYIDLMAEGKPYLT